MFKEKDLRSYASQFAAKGGRARAQALSAEERKRISKRAARARTQKLSPEERKAIARKAVQARWAKRGK